MQLTSFSRAGMFALFALTMLITGPAGAKDGRDFAGYYSLTNAAEKGGAVELTLALQLFNYSGADLKQAVVTVRESHPSSGSTGYLRSNTRSGAAVKTGLPSSVR